MTIQLTRRDLLKRASGLLAVAADRQMWVDPPLDRPSGESGSEDQHRHRPDQPERGQGHDLPARNRTQAR